MYVCVCVCKYTCACSCMCMCMYQRIYVCACVCVGACALGLTSRVLLWVAGRFAAQSKIRLYGNDGRLHDRM